MLEYKDYEEKIKRLTRSTFMYDKKIISFFEQAFIQFNELDQKKILEIFERTNSVRQWNIFLEHHESVKNVILTECKKHLDVFLAETDVSKSQELLKFAEVYVNVNGNQLDDDVTKHLFQKISNMLSKDSDIINMPEVKNILSYYIKEIIWNSKVGEYNDETQNRENYKLLEQLVVHYIDGIDCNDKLYDNELLTLISETQGIINSETILKRIHDKFPKKIDLEEYDVKNIDENEQEKLYNDLIIYRLQNGIIPKEFCIYLTSCVDNKNMRRMANVDYIKYYLKENQIETAAVFFDEQLMTPGVANFRRMALNNKKLNEQSFHEATHVMQQEKLLVRMDFLENRYAMLKDFILQKRVGWQVYNHNHSRWLFEIDADIEGAKRYYQYLKDMESIYPGSSGMSIDEINKCIEYQDVEKQRRLLEANTIYVEGKEKNKSQLFDEVLLKETELLNKHPILQVEYNLDGSKKTFSQILAALEQKYVSDKNEEEIVSIANCILGEVNHIDGNEYSELVNYTTNNTVILSIKSQALKQLQQQNQIKSTLEVGVERTGNSDTKYIDDTETKGNGQISTQDKEEKHSESDELQEMKVRREQLEKQLTSLEEQTIQAKALLTEYDKIIGDGKTHTEETPDFKDE